MIIGWLLCRPRRRILEVIYPKGRYVLTNCPGINEAVGFAASPISTDFYYATKDQIYTIALGDSPECDSGEPLYCG